MYQKIDTLYIKTITETHKPKPPLSAIFALNEALRRMNYTASMKPVNGHSSAPVRLIELAA